MVKDITDLLETDYDKDHLVIRIPDALDHLKGKDAKFEMVKSNSLQPLSLIYSHNIVTRTIGLIFINDTCKDATYKDAEKRGQKAIELF